MSRIRVNQIPGWSENDIEFQELYDDKVIRFFIHRLYQDDPFLNEVRASNYYDGDLNTYAEKIQPKPHNGPVDTTPSTVEGSTKDSFQALSKKKQDILSHIEEEYGVGQGSDTWTVPGVADEGGFSENTVRKYIPDQLSDWVADTNSTNKNGASLYRMTQSRFENVMADGGLRWTEYNWDDVVDNLRGKQIFETDQGGGLAAGGNTYPRDWFGGHHKDDVIEIFDRVLTVANSLKGVSNIRTIFQRKWGKCGQRKRQGLLQMLVDEFEEIEHAFRELFERLETLSYDAFGYVSQFVSKNVRGEDKEITQRQNPENILQGVRERLQAKRFAIITTHLQPLTQMDISDNARKPEPGFLNQVDETQTCLSNFLHWAWRVYQDFLDGAEDSDTNSVDQPPTGSSAKSSIEEGTEIAGQVLRNHTKGPMMMKEKESLSWEKFYEKFRGRANSMGLGSTPEEESAVKYLKKFHNWGYNGDGDHAGVYVWDEGAESHGPIDVRVKIVEGDDADFFEDVPRRAKWQQEPDLMLPPPNF